MNIQAKLDAVLEYLKKEFPGIPVMLESEYASEVQGIPPPAEAGHVKPNGETFRLDVNNSIKLLHLSRKFLDDRNAKSIKEYLLRGSVADELRKKGDRRVNIP